LERCTALSTDLDGLGGRRTHKLTDELLATFDPGTLWDEYGIDDDVVVSKWCLFSAQWDCTFTQCDYSLLHMISLAPIFTRYYHQIFCIN